RRASRSDEALQIRDESGIALERKRLSGVPVLAGNAGALVSDGAGDRRKAHWRAIPDVVIHAVERPRRREVPRITVPNRDLHAGALVPMPGRAPGDSWTGPPGRPPAASAR